MKIYMKNPKGRLSDSCCLLKDFCQKLLFISFQKKGGNKCNHSNSKAVFHISKRATVIVKDYFLCLFSKRIVCKSEPEVHFYRKLRYARED